MGGEEGGWSMLRTWRGGERGRGLTAVAALRSVVGAREWYTRATAVADASDPTARVEPYAATALRDYVVLW